MSDQTSVGRIGALVDGAREPLRPPLTRTPPPPTPWTVVVIVLLGALLVAVCVLAVAYLTRQPDVVNYCGPNPMDDDVWPLTCRVVAPEDLDR